MNITGTALFLGLLAIVTGRLLGPSGRGVVVIFMTLSSMLMVLGSMGVNTFARVNLVSTDNKLALSDYLGAVAALATCQILLSLSLGWLTLSATHSLQGSPVLFLFIIYTVLNTVSYMLRDGLYALGFNIQASRADQVAAGAQLLLVLLIWLTLSLTIDRALVAISSGQAAEVIYLAVKFRSAGLRLRPTYSPQAFANQLRGGVPAVVTNLGQTFIFRLDRVILGLFAVTSVVGIYSVAVTMTEVLLLVPVSVAQVIFHRVAAGQASTSSLRNIRAASIGLSSVCAIALGLTCPWLINELFGPSYLHAVAPLRVLLIGAVAMGSYLVDIACMNASGRLRSASAMTVLGFVLITGLDLVLIPTHEATGAAAASSIAYCAMAVAGAGVLRRIASVDRRQ